MSDINELEPGIDVDTLDGLVVTPMVTTAGNFLRLEVPALPGLQIHMREAFANAFIARLCIAMADFPDESGATNESELARGHALALTLAKRTTFEKALEGGTPVLVNLDARADGVDLPDQFRGEYHLTLRYGSGLTPPILDLNTDAQGISATLGFGGIPYPTKIPWRAIYAISIEGASSGIGWPESFPDEIRRRAETGQSESMDVAGQKPTLGLVPAAPPSVAEDIEQAVNQPTARPGLRLVRDEDA